MKPEIYHVSGNPVKSQRLQEAMRSFSDATVQAADVVNDRDENAIQREYERFLHDIRYPLFVSLGKVRLAKERLKGKFPEGTLIATDSVNATEDKETGAVDILNKPKDPQEAIDMLRRIFSRGEAMTLAGTSAGSMEVSDQFECVGTLLQFSVRPADEITIAAYVRDNWDEIKNSAGGLAMFGPGKIFIDTNKPARIYRYTITSEKPELVYEGSAVELYISDDSFMRKAVSGTYPPILREAVENIETLAQGKV